ncbi:MAG: T9SS type A sorting domain-containing protein, partial [Saprospiraceae bacterium]
PGYSPDLLNIMAYTNYYACKPVFTAGQGVRMRNTIANSPVLANITHTVFPGNITITGSETWPSVAFPYTGNVILQGSVTIEPGATLTINSGTIHFPESGQVIIKPGGLLVLKATLTSNCSIWKGVTVQGTAGIAQSTTTQGKLLALSGSSIEHAATGVSASNGGIVDCTGTLFKNNRHGAWINPHSFSQELTRFSQCRFTNDYYNRFSNSSFFLQPISHLVLSNVKASSDAERIKIAGCEFHTAFPGPNLNPAIVGILSLQSDFKVTALFTPSGNIRSHFENLNFGILAKFSANIGGSVSNSDFKSCNVGIHALGQRSFSVNGNNFEMGELPAELPFYSYPQYPEQIGVWYKGNMPQLFLVGNNFKKTGTSNTIETIGSLAEGLGSYNHVFLLNDYEGITYANLANGSNASASGQRGLHYLCNTNLPPQRYDFAVEALATIRSEQGQAAGGGAGVFLSATNTFSYTNGLNGDYSDFLNEGGSAVNYYYNTAINEEPLDYLGIFKVFTPATSPCASLAVCPEPCKTETEINAIKADYYAEAALYENAEQGHAQAILNNNAALAATEATTMAVHRDRMDYNIGMVLLHERYGSNRPDSIRKWTAAFDRAAAELHIALSYFDEQNYTAADAVLQLIPQRYSLTTRETAEVNALRDMVALLDDKNLSDLDATTIATLVPIAADDVLGLATTWARSILIPYGYWYRPTYRLPDGIGERSNSQEQIPPTAKQKSVVIYPNPAGNQLDIRLSAPELGQIQVKVFSSLGRLLDHQQTEAGAFTISLDVAHLPSGVYIVQVSDSSRILTTEKIIIQH